MPTIPKIYIALREMPIDPPGLETKIRSRYSDLAKRIPRPELVAPVYKEPQNSFTFLTNRKLLTDPPREIFSDPNNPTFVVLDVEGVKPDELSELRDREVLFRQNFKLQAMPPRIVLFKDVVPENLLERKHDFQPFTLGKMLPIDEVFKDYRKVLDVGLAVRAQSLNAAVDIVFANLINSNQTPLRKLVQV